MNPNSPIKKYGIPAVIILVIIAVLYFLVGRGGNSQNKSDNFSGGLTSTVTDTTVNPNNLSTAAAQTGNTAVGGTIVELLRDIGSITLPDDIFSNNAFNLLSDGTVSLPKYTESGRRNPFSALSGSGTATSINPTISDQVKTPTALTPTPDVQNVPTTTVPEPTAVTSTPTSTTTSTSSTKTTTSSKSAFTVKKQN